jgi:4'-phosphopantetheinyl transferase
MRDDDVMAVARRVFADDELDTLEPLPPAERRREFYRLWVRKEAYLKATGEGLLLEPALVSVAGPRSEPGILRPVAGVGAGRPWTVLDLPTVAGCAGALVVGGVGLRVRCRDLDAASAVRVVGVGRVEAVVGPAPGAA